MVFLISAGIGSYSKRAMITPTIEIGTANEIESLFFIIALSCGIVTILYFGYAK